MASSLVMPTLYQSVSDPVCRDEACADALKFYVGPVLIFFTSQRTGDNRGVSGFYRSSDKIGFCTLRRTI